MEREELDRQIIDMNSKITELHTIVCGNGLIQAVKEQAGDIKQLNERVTDIVLNRELTCPVKIAMDERNRKRGDTFDRRLVVYGLIIGLMSMLPEVVRLFF